MKKNFSLIFSIVGVLVVVITGWIVISRFSNQTSVSAQAAAQILQSGQIPSSPEIEAEWGIRPVMVALTAANGMIDFRFQILDVDKATNMHAKLESLPYFITADGKKIALSELMGHHPNFEVGRTYYILYPNLQNTIKPNTLVTVVIGNLKLENVPVR
jgi:hypothetical protein